MSRYLTTHPKRIGTGVSPNGHSAGWTGSFEGLGRSSRDSGTVRCPHEDNWTSQRLYILSRRSMVDDSVWAPS